MSLKGGGSLLFGESSLPAPGARLRPSAQDRSTGAKNDRGSRERKSEGPTHQPIWAVRIDGVEGCTMGGILQFQGHISSRVIDELPCPVQSRT